MEDSSDSDSKSEPRYSEEEGDDEDGAIVDRVLEGYRLVDLDILSRSIGAQLLCKLSGGDLGMMELERKELSSKFVFHCRNRECDNQNPFPAHSLVEVENLSVSSVNRCANFAMQLL